MKVIFYGACREVTGSNILIEAAGKKILLDCGFFQGSKLNEERNWQPFAYNPTTIDFVVVCHAHLDHVGRLPKLFAEGFRGKIFATAPTIELAHLVMTDNEKLMNEESRRGGLKPLYGPGDVSGVIGLFEATAYDKTLEIWPGIKLTLRNAGHILGSSFAQIEADGQKLIYSSDLGNAPSALLDPPEDVTEADYLICESTYGGRVHEDISKRHEKLNSIIDGTVAQNGVLLIPTFAIERTQELLHDIMYFCQEANCTIPNFYLDSPLAEKVTSVFEKYPEFLNARLRNANKSDIFGLERIKMTSSAEQSKQIDSAPKPKVIIAGSGMMNGGRILFHLQNYIEEMENTLLIVGYQAAGTLGRRLLDGDKKVRIFGKSYEVRAKVLAIGSYSAHADNPQIMAWISKMKNLKKVFLVHGETSQAMILTSDLHKKLGLEAIMPQTGEEYILN